MLLLTLGSSNLRRTRFLVGRLGCELAVEILLMVQRSHLQLLKKMVHSSSWAAVTKCYRLGGLNSRNLSSHRLEG